MSFKSNGMNSFTAQFDVSRIYEMADFGALYQLVVICNKNRTHNKYCGVVSLSHSLYRYFVEEFRT